MKNGFELLKTRGIDDYIDIDLLENNYQTKLPEKYRLFCKTFVLGDDSLITDKYINPNNPNDFRQCSFYLYAPNKEIRFAGFNALENVLEYQQNLDEWINNEFLPIGHVGFNGAILLGTTGTNYDKILLHDFDKSPEYAILADDIFQFVRGLVLEPIGEENLAGGAKFSKFYKKWNENFWRVAE